MHVLLLSLSLVLLVLPRLTWAEERIAIIVGKTAVQERVTPEELARIYLRQRLVWSNGIRVVPTNLPVAHPLRRSFSQQVLGALPEDFEGYWGTQYFHGLSPPYVLDSEEAVVQFVAVTPGAIGYVSISSVTNQVHTLFSIPLFSHDSTNNRE